MSYAKKEENVLAKLQDKTPKLSSLDIENSILSTLVGQFSKDFPSVVTFEYTGDGGYDYTLPTTPTAKVWVDGFSVICGIELPAGEQIPVYLEVNDYRIYDNGTSKQLRFLVNTPQTTDTFRLVYTVPYEKATIDNIPTTHLEAFYLLAASELCGMLARLDTESIDPTIEADSVNHHDKKNKWSSNGTALRKRYNILIGADKNGVKPASTFMDWDMVPRTRGDAANGRIGFGGDYIYHRSRGR